MDAIGVSASAGGNALSGAQVSADSPPAERRWPKEAYDLVSAYQAPLRHPIDKEAARAQSTPDVGAHDKHAEMRRLIAELVVLTGRPRQNCRRFARRLGVVDKQPYREWTKNDQQQLLDLISKHPAYEVARTMRRSLGSVRAMLHRLGASAQMGHDWFTVYTLAEALHTRGTVVQSWIDRGWLKARIVHTGRLRKEIIEADAFAEFCKLHGKAVVGRRLRIDRLEFVKNFVFPASHTDLLPVRESKKERAAFDATLSSGTSLLGLDGGGIHTSDGVPDG